MFRFIDVAPRVDPSEALVIGLAVIVGGAVLFGLMLLLARKLARSGKNPGGQPSPE
jgi:hypothetical protein